MNKRLMPTVKRGLNFLSCVSGILVPLKRIIVIVPRLFFGFVFGANAKLIKEIVEKNLAKGTKIIGTIVCLLLAINCVGKELYKVSTERLTVRKEAGADQQSLGYLRYNDVIEVVDKSNPKWFKVDVKGVSGYVNSRYLILVPSKKEAVNVIQFTKNEKMVIAALLLLIFMCLVWLANVRKPTSRTIIGQSDQVIILRPKSVIGAIALAFLFGPFGMFYSTVRGALTMILLPVVIFGIFIYHLYNQIPIDPAFMIGSLVFAGIYWFVCIIWAALAADKSNRIPITYNNYASQ